MTMFAESLRAFLKPVIAFLDDDDVTEILINGPEEIWIERKGKLEKTTARFSPEGLVGFVRNVAQFVGRPISEERPRIDARLPDGSRIHAVIAPVARGGSVVAIRKFFREKLSIDSLLSRNALTAPMSRLLEVCIGAKLNTLVAGGTSSGKTTLLNIVASFVPSHERILVLEDSSELQMNQPHVVPLEARPPDKNGKGAVDIGDLLHSALRLRPDRIVVGEVRGGEALHLVQAMNTGHGGSLATTHANTAVDTLRRIETLCLMGGTEIPLVAVRAQVASALDMVVVCARLADGTRKITSISEVLPLTEKGEYRTQDLFVFTPVGRTEKGDVVGYHGPTGVVPRFAARVRAYGFKDLTETFFDPKTYGLPPPPVELFAEHVETAWAPSLKHRGVGEEDEPHIEKEYAEFVSRLMAGGAAPARPRPTTAPRPLGAEPKTPVSTSPLSMQPTPAIGSATIPAAPEPPTGRHEVPVPRGSKPGS